MTLFLILLVSLETAAFVFAVFFVFSDVAADDIRRVTTISDFRSHATKCGYLQRDLQLSSFSKNTGEARLDRYSNRLSRAWTWSRLGESSSEEPVIWSDNRSPADSVAYVKDALLYYAKKIESENWELYKAVQVLAPEPPQQAICLKPHMQVVGMLNRALKTNKQGVMKNHIQKTNFLTYTVVGQDWFTENKQYFGMVSDVTRKVISNPKHDKIPRS